MGKFRKWCETDRQLMLFQNEWFPSVKLVESLRPQLAQAAQMEYNAWNQNEEGLDDELGGGGICQEIARVMCIVLSNNGVECAEVSANVGDQHVWVVARLKEGVFEIDIPPSVYERGGGYSWTKIKDVTIRPQDIVVYCIDNNPNNYENYIG